MSKKTSYDNEYQIKVTSRYSEYLAIKSFSDKITDKHELETIVTQFQSIESYKTKHANLLCKVQEEN